MDTSISTEFSQSNSEYSNSRSVAIICEISDSMSLFTATEMKLKMEIAGYYVYLNDVEDLSSIKSQHRIILTTLGSELASNLLSKPGISPLPSKVSQGYSIRKITYDNYTCWYIIGSDKIGVMYGGLDFSEALQFKSIDELKDIDKKPFIINRGIKFNIPLDARTPSYSDAGDSAQANISNMWDMRFWSEFLDEMAKNHFNVLSLWSLHPFPSMVKVPSYPNVALNDVMKTTSPLTPHLEGRDMSTSESLANLETIKIMNIDEKIKFWQSVMEYAQNRGIDIFIITWNTFVYGTEQSGYGFTTSLTDTKTQDYFRKSVEALINTYPLLKGIGVTTGENMTRDADVDEPWLYNTYGQGINDALAADENRTFSFIHRIQYANIQKALNAFSGLNPRCTINTSFKYSQAHMYSSSTPDYIHAHNDSYLKDIGAHKTWLTVRDDDYYMFRGGSDPEFVRTYVKNMPHEKLQGFYIGPDGYTWGREYISRDPESPNQQIIKKRWYSFMLWGRLGFDPEIPQSDFIKILSIKFPKVNAENLFEAWSKVSQIVPKVNRLHNSDCQLDFQWYPEACTSNTGFQSINRFINTKPQSGEGIMSIPEYAITVLNGASMTNTTPVEIAYSLYELSDQAEELVKDMCLGTNKELHQTIEDINALALLGKYYSKKILGAVNKCISDQTSDIEKKMQYKNAAIENLKDASDCWKNYSAKVSSLYVPQTLTRLIPDKTKTSGLPRYVDVTLLQKYVDNDIELV